MTSPLDEKGRTHAIFAYASATGDCVPEAMIAAIRAYLSAVALPDELEVVAYLVKDDPELGDYLTKSRQAAERSSYGHIRLADADQAHSTIAALRADCEEYKDAGHNYYARALRAEAEVKRLTEALNEIRELNMSGADENGHRWANSDLIEQTVVFALSGSKE